mmetsp:Transcript_35530/g.81384  ORF Transcript_35530/g.81384 Transcript_35530/m.81384 type:complete len:241 (+) Transcript_35530:48-770(+)
MEEADFAGADHDGMQAGGAAAPAEAAAAPGSAQVVMPPGMPAPAAQGGAPPMIVAPDGSLMPGMPLGPDGEPAIPPEEEEGLPFETDADGWLELLRDGYLRQLREENEYPEPPAFHRAMHFGAKEDEPVPPGKYPKQALNIQLHLLLRARAGEGCMPQGNKGCAGKGKHMKGGGNKGYGKGGPGQAQLLLEAAKALVGQQGGGRGQGLNLDWGSLKGGKGKGKDKGKSKWSPSMPRSVPY